MKYSPLSHPVHLLQILHVWVSMTLKGVTHLGDSFRVGMWQARWKTLGHLSQQSSSPPFWHTAHQSSLGSSSGSALFSDSGWDGGWGCLSLESDPGAGTGADPFCCSRGFDCTPVLLSGRLDPLLDCTCRWECAKSSTDSDADWIWKRLWNNSDDTIGSKWQTDQSVIIQSSCYSYKTNFVVVLGFVLYDDDGTRGGPPPSLCWRAWCRLRSLLPRSRPSIQVITTEKCFVF